MDVFSGVFRQSCTAVSGTVDDDIIRTRLRKGISIKKKQTKKKKERRNKSPQFSYVSSHTNTYANEGPSVPLRDPTFPFFRAV